MKFGMRIQNFIGLKTADHLRTYINQFTFVLRICHPEIIFLYKILYAKMHC